MKHGVYICGMLWMSLCSGLLLQIRGEELKTQIAQHIQKVLLDPQESDRYCEPLCTPEAVGLDIKAVCGFCYESCNKRVDQADPKSPPGMMMAECQNKNYSQPFKRAQAKVSVYEKAIKIPHAQLERERTKYTALNVEYQKLKLAAQGLKKTAEGLQKKAQGLQEKLGEQVSHVKSHIGAATGQLLALQNKISKLQQELSQQIKLQKDTQKELAQQAKLHQQALAEVKQVVPKGASIDQTEFQEMQNKYDALQAEYKSLKSELKATVLLGDLAVKLLGDLAVKRDVAAKLVPKKSQEVSPLSKVSAKSKGIKPAFGYEWILKIDPETGEEMITGIMPKKASVVGLQRLPVNPNWLNPEISYNWLTKGYLPLHVKKLSPKVASSSSVVPPKPEVQPVVEEQSQKLSWWDQWWKNYQQPQASWQDLLLKHYLKYYEQELDPSSR